MDARALNLLHQAEISNTFGAPFFRIVWANARDTDTCALHIHVPQCRRADAVSDATTPEPNVAAALVSADFACVMMDVPGGVTVCPCAEPQTVAHQRRWVYDRTAE